MSLQPQATIDLSALAHNLQQVRARVGDKKIIAMVKSDAYGHGLLPVAQTLAAQGVDAFGVIALDEALALRNAGITQRIVLMSGFYSANDMLLMSEHRIDLVVHHARVLDLVCAASLPRPIRVWLKIETGMHRLGVPMDEVVVSCQRLKESQNVCDDVGVITHLSGGETPDDPQTKKQLSQFRDATIMLFGPRSVANSVGILHCPEALAASDWVRPGGLLYGMLSSEHGEAEALGFKPVMTLQATLMAIKPIKKGAVVGYGETWTASTALNVGVINIGYGEGYPRHAASGTPILIRGQRCALIGRVSMNMITVDLTACPDAQIGDTVTLWGTGLPVEEVARSAGTIAYDLTCGVKLFRCIKGHEEKAMRWRCRRGMLELDRLLLAFFDHHYARLTPAQKIAFEALLELPDPVLLSWFLKQDDPTDDALLELVEMIRGVHQ